MIKIYFEVAYLVVKSICSFYNRLLSSNR